jgi:hypothetical protein
MVNINLFQKLLPPEEKIFFNYFEISSGICFKAAEAFKSLLESGYSVETREKIHSLKHESADVTKKNLTHLNETFITPIDREDIQIIAQNLNKITKKIAKATMSIKTYRIQNPTRHLKEQSQTLILATSELTNIVPQLKNITNTKEFFDSTHKMSEIEHKGDQILHDAMEELFSGSYDALSVIKLKDIYKDIENALDLCFEVSDHFLNVILKHT